MDNVGATLHTALFLAYEENKNSSENIDRLYLMKKIIFTSLADLILSDINSGTKGYIKKLDSEIFEKLYEQAYGYFLSSEAPQVLKDDFRDTLSQTGKTREDQIFMAAKKYV
jgi:hypothetical protein